jgi:hypothetical protein
MDRGPTDLAVVIVKLAADEDAVTYLRTKLQVSAMEAAELKCKTC